MNYVKDEEFRGSNFKHNAFYCLAASDVLEKYWLLN